MEDVLYEWTYPESGKSIVTAADMTLSQFDLIGWSHNSTVKTKHTGESFKNNKANKTNYYAMKTIGRCGIISGRKGVSDD